MKSEGIPVKTIHLVSGAPNATAKKKALHSIKTLTNMQTYGLPKSLHLKVGAQYMITVNIVKSDELVIGNTGIIQAIYFGHNKHTMERRPLRIWLKSD